MLNQVTYRWPNAEDDCLRDISLELREGEWLALTGDNGAGKSTLLRIMAGLLAPSAGTVTFRGTPLIQLKNRQRAGLFGVLFQEAENQIFHSNVIDEVAFGLKLQKRPAAEINRRTQAALALCHLEEVANAHPLIFTPRNGVWLPSPVWKRWLRRFCYLMNPVGTSMRTGWLYLSIGLPFVANEAPALWRSVMTPHLRSVISHELFDSTTERSHNPILS